MSVKKVEPNSPASMPGGNLEVLRDKAPPAQTQTQRGDAFEGGVRERESLLPSLVRNAKMAFSAAGAAARNLWEANATKIDSPEFASHVATLGSRRPPDVAATAQALQDLLTARAHLGDELRIQLTQTLVAGLSASEMGQVIDAYVERFGRHPEFDIRSDGLGQPFQQLKPEDELSLAGIINRASMRETAVALRDMLEKPQLTLEDRQQFMSTLPLLGLWDKPTRTVEGMNLDAPERQFLLAAWNELAMSTTLDQALAEIEAKLKSVAIPPPTMPREKTIALLASSHGAQWQETMDFALEMKRQGYDVRFFTPDGADGRATPVGFQRDSLLVSQDTTELGLGAPPRLNPRDPTVAREIAELLGKTQPASTLNAKQVGLIYLAGGLGFNEDVARATKLSAEEQSQLSLQERAVYLTHGTEPVKLELNESVKSFMGKAVAEKLPFVTLCHGATAFAATQVQVEENGRQVTEAFNKNLLTSSLPPFEAYVRGRDSVAAQFLYGAPNVDTHQVMANAGGRVNPMVDPALDALDMAGVSIDYRPLQRDAQGKGVPGSGFVVLSGPGPQTALRLAQKVLELDAKEDGFLKH